MILRHAPTFERTSSGLDRDRARLAERHQARRVTDDRRRWPAPARSGPRCPAIGGRTPPILPRVSPVDRRDEARLGTSQASIGIAVIGAGTMGAGIAQLALEAGHPVVIHDPQPDAMARAIDRIRAGLARRAAKLDLDADAIDDWVEGRLARLRTAPSIESAARAPRSSSRR